MKRNIWVTGVALLLTASLLTSCTTTATWREIRKHPAKYAKRGQVAIEGEVVAEYLYRGRLFLSLAETAWVADMEGGHHVTLLLCVALNSDSMCLRLSAR
jgi:hypothetical protein